MRPIKFLFTLCLTSTASAAVAGDFNHWPLQYTFGNATEASLTGNFAYDYNNFSGDDRLKDRNFMRRKELGISIKRRMSMTPLLPLTSNPNCGLTFSSALKQKHSLTRITVVSA